MPIAGDTTKLPFADGLTQLEQRMAWNMHFLCRNQPGSQQLRLQMGHAQFGARVVYGDCLFYTLSQNPQHSAWVLKFSRYRDNDPYVTEEDATLRQCAQRTFPPLTPSEDAELTIPPYKIRRIVAARDPMAVMDAFGVHIRLRLPRLFGMRSCPDCPRCNDRGNPFPCQNRFGSNMRATGGFVGGCVANGSAVEHQGEGTPHIHGDIHVACVCTNTCCCLTS